MAGTEFNADPPDDLTPENPENIPNVDEVLQNIPQPRVDRARQLLERYMRDFEKSFAKKGIDLENLIVGMNKRGVPRADTQERMTQEIDAIQTLGFHRAHKFRIQFEKELDGIETRLNTQGGTAEDLERMAALRERFQETFSGVQERLTESIENLRRRGEEVLSSRQERSQNRTAREEAQRRGEEARREFLEANREEIELNSTETILGAIDRILLMGRRGSIFGDQDRRQERLRALHERAREVGEERYNQYAESNIQTEDERGQYDGSGIVPGFRSMDIRGNPTLGRLVGAASLAFLADSIVSGIINSVGETAKKIGTGKQSTSEFVSMITLSDKIPLNVGGKVLTKLVEVVETISNDITQQITAFSPELISASVDRQIALLEQNLEFADELGPSLANQYRLQTDILLEQRKAGRNLVEALSPLLTDAREAQLSILQWFNGSGGTSMYDVFIRALKLFGDTTISGILEQQERARISAEAGDKANRNLAAEWESFMKFESFSDKPNTNIPKAWSSIEPASGNWT